MFCDDLEKSLNEANQHALKYGHVYITVEHLLLALLDNSSVVDLIRTTGADLENIKKNILLYLEKQAKVKVKFENSLELEHTDSFKRVIQRAIFHAQTLGKVEVNGAYVLAAILSECESQAFYILQEEGVTKTLVHEKISGEKLNFEIIEPIELEGNNFFESLPQNKKEESLIDQYATNLNTEVLEGRIDPVIGRENEISRLEQILCRRVKNNPIVVGEAGVGKTAVIEGLVWQIIEKQVHPKLQNTIVYSIDLGALLAGTKYRGDFEKRFKSVLNEFRRLKNTIIFIDEIHTIIGAGSASGGSIDAANLLKPLLTKGDLRCIGATTYQEHKTLFEKDHALSRRFQKIDVKEATKDQTFNILKGLKENFESHHNVRYSLSALKAAIDLSSRYMGDKFLPDKAIDVIDETGAAKCLTRKDDKLMQVDVRDVEKIVAKLANIPPQHISASDKIVLKTLERDLNMLIYGQNKAINHICSAIKLSRSGLSDPNRPIGCFLFTGPTGVGKTELAKNLASILNLKLNRFDMSEYMEKHTSSQLVGAPPGYVGFDQGGQLTESIIKEPHCVLLLDEIEKAHQDLYNLLLQVMDYGKLTDNTGRVADFRNVIIIMTSNSGAEDQCRNKLGFSTDSKPVDINKSISKDFSPEFRNRLDGIIQFNRLDKQNIAQIVDKFLSAFEVQLQSQGIDLIVDKNVKEYLAKQGYDPKMGARPMARLINEKIKKPVADALLFSKLKSGDKAKISMYGDLVKLNPILKKVKS